MKCYQKGGMTPTPKPDMRSYEEQQKDIDAQREKRAAEKAAQKEREAEDAAMDRKMREGYEKSKKKPLYKKGGAVHKMPDGTMMKGKSHKGYNKGGKIDGCAVRGKTRGRMC